MLCKVKGKTVKIEEVDHFIDFADVKCSEKEMISIEIFNTHLNTIYAIQKVSELESILTYWIAVSEEDKETKIINSYFKLTEEKLERGLDRLIQTNYYQIRNEGGIFYFNIIDSSSPMLVFKGTVDENLNGLTFQRRMGILGSVDSNNADFTFPLLYATNPVKGSTEPVKYVVKQYKILNKDVKIQCNALDKSDLPEKDISFKMSFKF